MIRKKNQSLLPSSVWVVIPAYNEAERIKHVLEKTKLFTQHIIVVNDGSKDATSSVAREAGVLVLDQMINLGKGAALRTGCDYALQKNAKVLVVMDADGQHQPEDIPRLIKILEEKKQDIVFSYRKLNKTMPLILKFGNNVMSLLINWLYNVNLKDSQSGFRCFTAEAYKKIRWHASDYSMESEMIARVGKNNLSYAEIPIQTIYLDKYKGTTIIDGIKVVLYILWWRLSR
ncbi:glycosyltransferase family 2 protein [Candidatus Woesearchaeota archaeon]|nr:glycosyltransferase family 2 protein [Candidatus Woesearchaeota archaeon]